MRDCAFYPEYKQPNRCSGCNSKAVAVLHTVQWVHHHPTRSRHAVPALSASHTARTHFPDRRAACGFSSCLDSLSDNAVCRKTNPQNAEVAKKTWTDGRKYTLTLVQPNGEQLSLIAGYVEEVSHQSIQVHPGQTWVA